MKNKINNQNKSFRMRITKSFQSQMKNIAAKRGKNVSKYIRDLVEQDCKIGKD